MAKPNMRLSEALLRAKVACCKSGCEYSAQICPVLWRRAFILHFGEKPVPVDPEKFPNGDDDPRWDIIFKMKMKRLPLLLRWQEREQAVQKAAE